MAKTVTKDPYGSITADIKLHNKGPQDITVDIYYGIGKNGKFEGSAWSVLTSKKLPVCQAVTLRGSFNLGGIPEGTYDFIVRAMDLQRKIVLGEKIYTNVVTVKKVTAPPTPPTTEIRLSIVDYSVNDQKQIKIRPKTPVTVKIYVDSNVRDTFWADVYITYNATTSVELYKELWVDLSPGRNEISAAFDTSTLDLGLYGVGAKIGKGSKTYAERYWGNVINISF